MGETIDLSQVSSSCRSGWRGASVLGPPNFPVFFFLQRGMAFISGTGFLPVGGASCSTCCHVSGEGKLTTHSEWHAKFSDDFVSFSRPSIRIQPSAQKEDISAKLVAPSSSRELINATCVPK
jgi:hypothetical protein